MNKIIPVGVTQLANNWQPLRSSQVRPTAAVKKFRSGPIFTTSVFCMFLLPFPSGEAVTVRISKLTNLRAQPLLFHEEPSEALFAILSCSLGKIR